MHSNNVPQVNAHSFQAKLRKWGDGFGKNRRQNKPQGNGLVKPVVATKALEPVSFTFWKINSLDYTRPHCNLVSFPEPYSIL